MRHGLIFDGEEPMKLTAEDIHAIGVGSPRELVQFYQATTVFRSVLKDLKKDNGDALVGIGDFKYTDELSEDVEYGYNTLCEELITVFGEDTALMIMANTFNSINLEKDEV